MHKRTARTRALPAVALVLAMTLGVSSCGFLDDIKNAIQELIAGGISFDTGGNLSVGNIQVLYDGKTAETWQGLDSAASEKIKNVTDQEIIDFINNRESSTLDKLVAGDRTASKGLKEIFDSFFKSGGLSTPDTIKNLTTYVQFGDENGKPTDWAYPKKVPDGRYTARVDLNVPLPLSADALEKDEQTIGYAKGTLVASVALGYEFEVVRQGGKWVEQVYNVRQRSAFGYRINLKGAQSLTTWKVEPGVTTNPTPYRGDGATDKSGPEYNIQPKGALELTVGVGPVSGTAVLTQMPDGAQVILSIDEVNGPFLRSTVPVRIEGTRTYLTPKKK